MAYDGRNVVTSYAVSKDLKNWEKKEPISHHISFKEAVPLFKNAKLPKKYFNFSIYDKTFDQDESTVYIWGKDSFLFPKKIKGKFALLHRVLPEIQIIYFDKFTDLTVEFWKAHLNELSKYIFLDFSMF